VLLVAEYSRNLMMSRCCYAQCNLLSILRYSERRLLLLLLLLHSTLTQQTHMQQV